MQEVIWNSRNNLVIVLIVKKNGKFSSTNICAERAGKSKLGAYFQSPSCDNYMSKETDVLSP